MRMKSESVCVRGKEIQREENRRRTCLFADRHLFFSIFYSNEQQFSITIVVVSLIKVLLFPVYSTQLVIASR
jgi:hypothetical protein